MSGRSPGASAPRLDSHAGSIGGLAAPIIIGYTFARIGFGGVFIITTIVLVEQESRSLTALRCAANCRLHLQAGVTTVRDTGSTDAIALAVARGVELGLIPGPRVVASGRVIYMTGGHADSRLPTESYQPTELPTGTVHHAQSGSRNARNVATLPREVLPVLMCVLALSLS